MLEALRRVCQLQPAYTPLNSPQMRERGILIRRTLPESITRMRGALAAALGPFGATFEVGASDGIGKKTEAPWVRFCSAEMSPNPREGFYAVLHFAADGSAVYVTVGCGSTVWANGELRSLPTSTLAARTGWARDVVLETFKNLEPFPDRISLGANAPLTKTFERATVFAKRVPVDTIEEAQFESLLIDAALKLRAIYEAQRIGRDISGSAQAELMIEGIAEPKRAQRLGQGFGLTSSERRAVEAQAMVLATSWLEAEGYEVVDHSATSPFDLEARRGATVLKIEVKGSTSDEADAVLMTHREVALHRAEKGRTGLIVVSSIRLARSQTPIATGGVLHAEIGWDIDDWNATPIAFKLSRRPQGIAD